MGRNAAAQWAADKLLLQAGCRATGGQVDRSRLNKGMWEYHKKQYVGAPRSMLLLSGAGSGAENVRQVPFQQKPMLKQAEQPPLPAAQAVPRLRNLPPEAAARPGRCDSCSVCKPVLGRQRRRQQQGRPAPPQCPAQQLWDAAGDAAEFAVAEAAAETARVPDDIIAGYQQLHAIAMLSPTAEQVGGLLVAALPLTLNAAGAGQLGQALGSCRQLMQAAVACNYCHRMLLLLLPSADAAQPSAAADGHGGGACGRHCPHLLDRL